MLKAVKRQAFRAQNARFAIIASKYNARYVDAMLRAAKTELASAGAKTVEVLRVPGAYEIPITAATLARRRSSLQPQTAPEAIICLGVILRGETVHAAHIGEAVSRALMDIQLRWSVPIIHEVLLLENEQQARVRCLGKTHNRGAEAAQTALAMTELFRDLNRVPGPTAPGLEV
jgi:6,7-dimethyl-8-ribityllumazine synthase